MNKIHILLNLKKQDYAHFYFALSFLIIGQGGSVVLNQRQFKPGPHPTPSTTTTNPRNIWQDLEMFLVVTLGWRV